MNVTIIGSGNMARGIATRLVHGGHNVIIQAKDASKGEQLVEHLRELNDSVEVNLAEVGGPSEDIVVLAVPYTEISSIASQCDGLKGKTVIDITNPVDFNTFQLIPEPGKSGAEEVAKLLPEATVVKAFNTTLAGALEAGKIDGKELDVFIAGDSEEAKTNVSELIKSSGMRPIDVGPLSNSRHLEGFGLIQMAVQDQIGTNWMSALKFIG